MQDEKEEEDLEEELQERDDFEEEIMELFKGSDWDLVIHDGYVYYDTIRASGYPLRRSLIFECFVWMIRKNLREVHGVPETEIYCDYMDGVLDMALDELINRVNDLKKEKRDGTYFFEDPVDGVNRVDIVYVSDYNYKDFFSDVAMGTPRFK